MSLYVNCDECGTSYPGDLYKCIKCGASTTLFASHEPLPDDIYIYDIETYPNIFTCAILHPNSQYEWMFEISTRKNESVEFLQFLHWLKNTGAKMVGFNNVNFDYPVIHEAFTTTLPITVELLYEKAMSIIFSRDEDRFSHIIWDNDQKIKQIDLFKIWHFDNKAKSTSLKALEFQMRMHSIQDLPFSPGVALTHEQMDELIKYNWHDIKATAYFYVRSLEQIKFRDELSTRYGKSFTNFNDTKIGTEIFLHKLKEAGVECSNKNQTHRASINLSECIPSWVRLEHPEFIMMLDIFKNKILYGTNIKALFTNLHCTIDDLEYHFGAGGQHSSRQGLFESNDEYIIVDQDVAAMYPSIAISNNFYPEHIGPIFSPIYKGLIEERMQVGKKTPLGGALKLAANGTYGNSGNEYSAFYDLKYLLSTTLTGQLALCMLIEQVIKIPNCTMIQSNTDGITYRIPRIYLPQVDAITQWWQNATGLTLEDNYYSRMWIRDVNNYLAEFETGDLKRKGAYEFVLEPHKDPSALIIPMAAVKQMVEGVSVEETILNHTDAYSFMIRAKVPRSNNLVLRYPGYGIDLPMQKITRYFVSKKGGSLVKIAPSRGTPGEYKRANKLTDAYFNQVMQEIGPGVWDERIHTKNKSTHADSVETGICVGNKVTECNNMDSFNWSTLDYEYYIKQAEKLIIC